jgi:NAD-dependent dihydropyrimidine dehydrogenase PreA subunit
MTESDDDIYRKLQQHLNSMPVGLPKAENGADIRVLKAFFSPEEAEFATFLTFFPSTAKDIWRRVKRKLGMSLKETEEMLETMKNKGLIYHGEDPTSGRPLYLNAPLAIGFFEFAINNLNTAKVEALEEYLDTFLGEFFSTGIPQVRTIPIDAAVTPKTEVMPYDQVWQLVDQMKGPFAVAPCVCVQERAVLGQKCEHDLTERCLTNSKWYVEQGHAREITKAEAKALVMQAQEEGLVIQPGNYKKGEWFCLCCGCCCGILSNAKKLEKPAKLLATNYYSEINPDLCEACGVCVERCPMDAVILDEVASINRDRCIGCGVCIPTCPAEAIQLIRKPEIIEPPDDRTDMFSKIMQKKRELKQGRS